MSRRKVARLNLDSFSRVVCGLESDAQANENSQIALHAARIVNGEGDNVSLKEKLRLAISSFVFGKEVKLNFYIKMQ